MKKITLILFLAFFAFGCQSIQEMAETRAQEESKLSSVFNEGKAKGPLHVIGFFSLSSQKSKTVPILVDKMQARLGDNVAMEYRRVWEDRSSLIADESSECARDQGKLEEFLDIYFNDYFEEFDKETMIEIALQTELDIDLFEECLESGIMKDRIYRDKSFSKKYNIEDIPTFIVERTIVLSDALTEEEFEKTLWELLDTLR